MSLYARTHVFFQAPGPDARRERQQAADEFAFIRRRQIEIAGINHETHAEPVNLREVIERGIWWPEGLITDGADHFVLPPAGANPDRTLSPGKAKQRIS